MGIQCENRNRFSKSIRSIYIDLDSRSNLCVVQIHKKLRVNQASQPSGTLNWI